MLIGPARGRQQDARNRCAERAQLRGLPDEQRPYAPGNRGFWASRRASRKQRPSRRPARRGADAEALGLVTFALDDIDWDDEIRVFMEERLSFSPDALTGMEANLRFGGPETMETKIFARLTAWQNWIFQRPNAVGNDGALKRYGTGQKAAFDMRRV